MKPCLNALLGCLTGRTGAGGIWSMHHRAGMVATASKDCSMALSAVTPDGRIALVHSFQQQHEGAVKCARWGRPHIVATCGNDM